MTVYHGSDIIVEKPDILHSMKRFDFARAFMLQLSLSRQSAGPSVRLHFVTRASVS